MIRKLYRKLLLGFTRNVAFTAPGAEDPRLRGRTYAVPFEDVWQAALALVDGGLKRWELVEEDDREGIIRGVAHSRIERFTSSVTVRVGLDFNAQTRVDGLAASRTGRYDLGLNARRLDRFFTGLDARVEEARARARERDQARETASAHQRVS